MGVGDLAWMTADWFFCPQLRKLSEATTRGHSMLVLVQRDNFQIVHLKGCKHFCLCDDVFWLEVTTCMTLRPGAVVVLRISGCVRVWVRAGIVIFSLVSPGSVFPQSQCVWWWYRLTLIPPLCAKAQCGVRGGTLIQVWFYASVCRFLFTFLTVRYSSSEFHTWHLYRCNYFATTSFSQIVDHTWKYSQEGWWAKGCRICKWDGRPVF